MQFLGDEEVKRTFLAIEQYNKGAHPEASEAQRLVRAARVHLEHYHQVMRALQPPVHIWTSDNTRPIEVGGKT